MYVETKWRRNSTLSNLHLRLLRVAIATLGDVKATVEQASEVLPEVDYVSSDRLPAFLMPWQRLINFDA